MPNDSHQRAAEFHEQAAHAHRAAAVHHGKEDHLTGHEHSKQAMEFSFKAHQASQFAHEKSQNAAQKPEQVILISNAGVLADPASKAAFLSTKISLGLAATFHLARRIHGFSVRVCTQVDKAFVPGYVVISVSTLIAIAFSPPEDALRKH